VPIRTVTFDWGDTLAANHGRPYDRVQTRAIEDLGRAVTGTEAPPDWVASCFAELKDVWRSTIEPARNPEHREFDFAALVDAWIDDLARPPPDPGRRRELHRDFFHTASEVVQPFPGVGEVLAELKSRGYRIGILSHVAWPREWCEEWYRRRDWHRHIDFFSLSSEVGYIKPSPRHYDHAIAAAGCAVEEICHVGDHPMRDVREARAYGFRAVLRRTAGVYDEEELAGCGADAEIDHVREIFAVLERW